MPSGPVIKLRVFFTPDDRSPGDPVFVWAFCFPADECPRVLFNHLGVPIKPVLWGKSHKEVVEDVPRLARGEESFDFIKTLLCKRAGMETRPYAQSL